MTLARLTWQIKRLGWRAVCRLIDWNYPTFARWLDRLMWH